MKDLPISVTLPAARKLRAGMVSQIRRPRGLFDRLEPGDRLWVREPFHLPPAYDHLSPTQYLLWGERAVTYAADGVTIADGRQRFARILPKLLHRLHLVVETVREARLQDLTEEDARACGWADRPEFAREWDRALSGQKYSMSGALALWSANPRVNIITFRLVRRPL